MIDQLTGIVTVRTEKQIVLTTVGIGFALCVADSTQFGRTEGKQETVWSYLHWHQEKGAVLYGFSTEQARTVFLLLIDCPKIGPAVALTLLAQATPGQIVTLLADQQIKALGSFSGVGAKKAELLVTHLKTKAADLVARGFGAGERVGGAAVVWHEVHEALSALHYSKQEIGQAVEKLKSFQDSSEVGFEVQVRRALQYLATVKN